MGKFNVIQFVSPYKNANTFIVEINEEDVVIIDLGNYPVDTLVDWLYLKKKNILGLILTHEHADHCYGVDELKNKVGFTLFCSEKCEINMRDPKQNFSRYIEAFEAFGVQSDAVIVKENQELEFKGFRLTVVETPGHSPGSICLFSEDMVFTGDTILNNVKSPLSFPHSNKLDFNKSLEKMVYMLKPGMKIYPGHDEPFVLTNPNVFMNTDTN